MYDRKITITMTMEGAAFLAEFDSKTDIESAELMKEGLIKDSEEQGLYNIEVKIINIEPEGVSNARTHTKREN